MRRRGSSARVARFVAMRAEKEREKEKRGELSSETLAPPPLADDRHESKTPSENVGPVTGIEEEK